MNHTLFEFGEWHEVSNNQLLREYLKAVWENRKGLIEDEREASTSNQPFLQFDGNTVKARNYVGFIQYGNEVIEIYPKVFKEVSTSSSNKILFLKHLFYWLSYCRKWRFPFTKASLNNLEIEDFPELIIYLIANQFLEVVSEQPLSMYQQVEDSLQTPKGTINFNRYLNKSSSRGNFHQIECDYEPFLFDNQVNRIIKYCSRLLMGKTNYYGNQRILQELQFILDEVDDVPCVVNDIDSITLNPFFEDYYDLLDNCRIILNQQLYSNTSYDLSQWNLLFPMEYVFEDFLAGFLERWFSDQWHVHYQKSDKYLAIDDNGSRAFNMQHDIFLTNKENKDHQIIVDAKYKIRSANFKDDTKKGIAQADMYQMLSYAYRRGCSKVLLVYPNLRDELHTPDYFTITSGFPDDDKIEVIALEIPFWSLTNFLNIEQSLTEVLGKILTK